MGRTSAALVWLGTRALVLWLYFGPHSWVTGDVDYFARSLAQVPEVGLDAVLVEYPLPGALLLAVPWLLTELVGGAAAYPSVVLLLAVLTDLAFTVMLFRSAARSRPAAMWVWLLAVPLLGATSYARFDLVPGVLAGLALLLLPSRPRLATAAAAVATGIKLWPALLLPAFAAPRALRRGVLLTAGIVGLALVGLTVAVAGWGRLFSPLTWQAERGLQIESVLATPAMLAWALGPGGFRVGYAEHNAFEVTGPGVGALLTASRVLGVLVLLGLAVLWLRAWRRAASGRDAVVWLCLAAVTAFMVSSKVLSPQYLLWLLPLAAAGLAVVEQEAVRRRLLRWAIVLLAATATTQLVFPVFYGALTRHGPDSVQVAVLLLARNAMLVWLLLDAVDAAWCELGRRGAQRGSALERQPPGPDGGAERTLR